MKERCTAILLAAGAGRRMESDVAKQYMTLCGKPVIWYGLQAFEKSAVVDDVILVVGKGQIPYVQQEIVEKYGFRKVAAVTEGGKERFCSVYNALQVIAEKKLHHANEEGYVFIHDGARPMVTEKILEDTFRAAKEYGACCAAVKAKDTIKIADEKGFCVATPDRNSLYIVQTPQVFYLPLIQEAYSRLMKRLPELEKEGVNITDDAMVVEQMMHAPVKMIPSSYENIKITTPEDMDVAARFLHRRQSASQGILQL